MKVGEVALKTLIDLTLRQQYVYAAVAVRVDPEGVSVIITRRYIKGSMDYQLGLEEDDVQIDRWLQQREVVGIRAKGKRGQIRKTIQKAIRYYLAHCQ